MLVSILLVVDIFQLMLLRFDVLVYIETRRHSLFCSSEIPSQIKDAR